jgi:hypothetical protein
VRRRLAFISVPRETDGTSYLGKVQNGVVVLPPDVHLPEGAEVEVTPCEASVDADPFLAAVEKSARPRPHWPADYALNHGHYVSGEPEKE